MVMSMKKPSAVWLPEGTVIRDRALHVLWVLFRTALLIGFAYVVLYPLLNMFSNAVRPVEEMFDPEVIWIPKTFTLDNIKTALARMNILNPPFQNNAIVNTILLDVVSALLQVAVTAMVGYGFARFSFKGRGVLFGIVILSIVVPVNSIVIPLYLTFQNFDFFGIGTLLQLITGQKMTVSLIDTPYAFYLPALLGQGIRSGLCIFIFRQFFRGMPRELEDAASIDGCGSYRTFFRVFVPNAAPPMLTTFIFSIVWYWNDYYYSTMFLPKRSTISISLSMLQNVLNTDLTTRDPYVQFAVMQAGALVSVIPLLIFYLIFQKHFTESVERTGIVG